MNYMAILGVISSVVGMAETAVKLGHDAKPFADILWNEVFGKDPQTDEEVAAVAVTVKTKLEELRARLHMPLPPKQDDDV